MVIQRIVDRSPGYSELANPRSRILIKLYMSDLIRRRRAVTTTQSSEPPTQLTSAATAPALMDHLTVGPEGYQAPAHRLHQWHHRPASTTDTTSTDASGSQPAKKNTRGPCRIVSTSDTTKRHQVAPTAELHNFLAHDIGHVVRSHCPMKWKSWKVMPDEISTEVRGQLSMNYNLEDLDDESLAYVNRLFSERYKQWKSDLHHYFEAFDDPQVALQEGCLKELEGREDSWAWLCAHFQAPTFVNKAKVNKGNRKKKTLLHHSGSRPFSYRMDARRQGVQIPRDRRLWRRLCSTWNELAESLHTTMVEMSQLVLQEFRLPTSSRYSDRVCGSSTGCWVSDLEGDIGSGEGTQTPFHQRSQTVSPSHSPAFQSRILMRRPPSPSIPSIPPDDGPCKPQTSESHVQTTIIHLFYFI
ncbi:hypothetical protein Prudu_819S000100 [Prunus dulcis]|uniref:Ankyrin repeat family protein n=1 Tax=Prunus dulcis TaxID=3755 RepID=A0A5H2XMB4_PRUDU|nr:hypothetical protein Prudu_819S000100 [Prunus dulcis]